MPQTGTARTTCAACQSDFIYPKGPCSRILHRPFSKMVGTDFDTGSATLWQPPLSSQALHAITGRAPRILLHLLTTLPSSYRYTQYARGSTLSAFAAPLSRPGSWCWSDARIRASTRSDHTARSRIGMVGSLYVRSRWLGKHLHWTWARPVVAPPCHHVRVQIHFVCSCAMCARRVRLRFHPPIRYLPSTW